MCRGAVYNLTGLCKHPVDPLYSSPPDFAPTLHPSLPSTSAFSTYDDSTVFTPNIVEEKEKEKGKERERQKESEKEGVKEGDKAGEKEGPISGLNSGIRGSESFSCRVGCISLKLRNK